jgi:hypothetical protein
MSEKNQQPRSWQVDQVLWERNRTPLHLPTWDVKSAANADMTLALMDRESQRQFLQLSQLAGGQISGKINDGAAGIW